MANTGTRSSRTEYARLRRTPGWSNRYAAATFARVADEMFSVAVVLHVLDRTGSAVVAGLAVASVTLPSLVTAPLLGGARERMAALDTWVAPRLHEAIQAVAAEAGAGLGKVAQPIRVAVSGGSVSPPIDVTLAILGRETTLRRLDRAIARCG